MWTNKKRPIMLWHNRMIDVNVKCELRDHRVGSSATVTCIISHIRWDGRCYFKPWYSKITPLWIIFNDTSQHSPWMPQSWYCLESVSHYFWSSLSEWRLSIPQVTPRSIMMPITNTPLQTFFMLDQWGKESQWHVWFTIQLRFYIPWWALSKLDQTVSINNSLHALTITLHYNLPTVYFSHSPEMAFGFNKLCLLKTTSA